MKTKVKGLSSVIILLAGVCLHAQQKPFIQTAQQRIVADKITANQRGELTYTSAGFSQRIAPDGYVYARVSKPDQIATGLSQIRSKNYANAVDTFNKIYNEYRFLGWDVEAVFFSAYALEKLGKNKEAIDKLNLISAPPKDPEKFPRYQEVRKLLAEIYIAEGKLNEAQQVLKELSSAKNDSIAAFSNNKQGDILLLQKKRRDALLMYLRTALLFDKSNTRERPEALGKIVKILKEDKNNRYLDFEKMFTADYPGAKLPE
ncbi:MAG: tetratricopeptide repeat protein [Victivallales bacterium]|nr:tetratricopeptide repeat protein [Victivallales bacterium]